MKSVMTHSFSNAPSIDAPRSSFDRSHGYKTAFDAGWLIPFYVDDVLPGDTFNLKTTAFARLSTPIFPIMDNMYMDTQFFFVPLRLVWDNARKFFGEQANPTDTIDYALPTFTSFTATEESIHDYMGLPVGKAMTPHSLYHRGYNLIYNEWYRDQNLQNSITVDTGDGPDTDTNYVLKKRGKRHDYFTSSLPWPQKGDAVSLPLGTSADVLGIGFSSEGVTPVSKTFREIRGNVTEIGWDVVSQQEVHNTDEVQLVIEERQPASGRPNIIADLSTATAATINDLREAFQVQKLLERDARSGTRYSELVKNHFGVNFYDVTYRPEYLGGGSTPINVSPIATTTDGTRDVGDLGAMGTALFTNHGFTKSFVEHGFVIGIVSVRADLTYQQGMPREFSRSTRYDFYWPSLAHLGEQEVLNKEIYYQGLAADEDVFGYQERYAEYRYKPSRITGQMRSTAATPLDVWHLSQEFSTLPVLGDTFIKEDPPIDRVIQVNTEPHFIFDSYTQLRCARPMPIFGVPGLIDHF